MTLKPRRRTRKALIAGGVALGLALTGCTGGTGGGSSQTKGATITVAWMNPAPPKAALDAFTKDTGITVKWTTVDWDSLQTKIAAAATSKTYFADVTDVDWSRVGQLSKLDWFYPIDTYIDTKKLKSDMPQLSSFQSGGKVLGIPFDSSYMVTTVNKDHFTRAGITTMPTTMAEYTDDLKQIKAKGISSTPLNIPFAAAEGLSTYWYEATQAFGGTVLDDKGKPQFTSPDSGGYKAAKWMVDSLKDGLVPAGNINVTDSQGMQNLMAKGVVSTTFSDYSGNVGSLYDVPATSTVTGKTAYLPTPGVDGTTSNLGNPDGIGIPRQAKYPAAAAKFIEWITATDNQADFAGANGPDKVMPNYPTPSRLSAMKILTENGKLAQGDVLSELLSKSKPVFSAGAPSWYPEFSRSVSTNLHAAAVGSISVDAAVKAIAAQADKLSSGS